MTSCNAKCLTLFFFLAAPFWSFLFFAMLFTLGLDSQFAIVETILSGILDFKPNLRSKKTIVIGIICVIGFFCGLPLTQQVLIVIFDSLNHKIQDYSSIIKGSFFVCFS